MLELCYLLPQTNIGTLVVSIVAIIGLILAKELNAYLSKKLPVPIPVELLGVSTQKYVYALIFSVGSFKDKHTHAPATTLTSTNASHIICFSRLLLLRSSPGKLAWMRSIKWMWWDWFPLGEEHTQQTYPGTWVDAYEKWSIYNGWCVLLCPSPPASSRLFSRMSLCLVRWSGMPSLCLWSDTASPSHWDESLP